MTKFGDDLINAMTEVLRMTQKGVKKTCIDRLNDELTAEMRVIMHKATNDNGPCS